MPSLLDLVTTLDDGQFSNVTGGGSTTPNRRQSLVDLVTSLPEPELRASTGPRSMVEEPEVPKPGMVETYGPAALRMGGPVVGALLGGPIGGAIGGAGGEVAARALAGQEQKILPPIVAGIGGAVMPGTTGRMAETMARDALINMGISAGSQAAEGRIPSGRDLPLAAILGAAGGAATEKFTPRQPEVPIPRRGPEQPLPRGVQQPEFLSSEVVGPQVPRPEIGALPRFDEAPVLPATPGQAPVELPTAAPRTTQTSGVSPLVGVPEPPPLVGAERAPIEAPEMTRGRLVDARGNVIESDSGQMVRDLLNRRGIADVEDVVRATSPQPQAPVREPSIELPFAAREGSGQETLMKGFLRGEREAAADVATTIPGPEQPQLVEGALPGQAPGKIKPVRAGMVEGEIPEGGDVVLPMTEAEQQKLSSPARDLLEHEMDLAGQEPVQAASRKAKPGMEQVGKRDDIRQEQELYAAVTDLRRRFNTLEEAANHAYSIMEKQPTAAQRILETVDAAGAEPRYAGLFDDMRTGSEVAVREATQQAPRTLENILGTTKEAPLTGIAAQRKQTENDILDEIFGGPMKPEFANMKLGGTVVKEGEKINEATWAARKERYNEAIAAGKSPKEALAISKILKGESGGAKQAAVYALGRAGVGAAIGGTQGDTPEERIKNAAFGGIAGAAASPAMIGKILGRGRGMTGSTPGSPLADAVEKLGDAARKAEYATDQGDFATAFDVANEAGKNIDTLLKRAGEVNPDNRLFRVVADEFMKPGPGQTKNLQTVTSSAQLLQKYSALAQRLKAMAERGDPEAAATLNTLFNPGGSWKRNWINAWRGSLTGRVSTGLRNAGDAASAATVGALDKLYTGTIEGIRTGKPLKGVYDAYDLGSTAARRTAKGVSEFLHLAQKSPDKVQKVIDQFPDITKRLSSAPEGLTGATGAYIRGANYVNNLQEDFFRKILFESELRSGLRNVGIDAEQAFKNPSLIPDEVLTRSMDRAMSGTFANSPRSKLGKDLMRVFNDNPELNLIVPFPRYIANRMQFIVDHNPLAVARLFSTSRMRNGLQRQIENNSELLSTLQKSGLTDESTLAQIEKAQANIQTLQARMSRVDTPAEVMGKWATGLTSLAAGAALADNSIAGTHWYKVKTSPGSNEEVDIRPFGTIAGFTFVSALYNDWRKNGKITMSQEDINQGIAQMGLRSGVGLTVMDIIGGRGQASLEDGLALGGDIVGMIGAGFLNPISQSKDLIGMAEPVLRPAAKEYLGLDLPSQLKFKETRDTPAMRVYGPIANQLPYVRDILPDAPSPTRTKMKEQERPLAHFLGANVASTTPIERELALQGIENRSIYPREQDKIDQRLVTRGQGQVVGENAGLLLANPQYENAPKPLKSLILKEFLSEARGAGLQMYTPETIERILRRRQSPEMQELLKMQGQ